MCTAALFVVVQRQIHTGMPLIQILLLGRNYKPVNLLQAAVVFVFGYFTDLMIKESCLLIRAGFLEKYQMNRLTDETWIQDQLQDRTGKPITLADIEHGLDEKSIAELLNNEHGRNFNHSRMQDLDVCKLIDHELLPRHGSTSVYRAVDTQKRRIYGILRHDYHIPDIQIRRCLVWDGNGI